MAVGVTVIDAVVAPVDQRNDVPPAALRVTAVPAQVVAGPLIVAVGSGLTETDFEAFAEQPFESVTCTEYVVVPVGVTVIDDVVAPVDQRKVVPPAAVRVTAAPAHVVAGPLIVAVGSGLTEMVFEALAEQPFASVTWTE